MTDASQVSNGNHKIVVRNASYYRRLRESNAERSSKNMAERAEALRLINREMISAGIDQPPTDLNSFARHLGVRAIRSTSLSMRGRLLREGNELVIEVNEKLDECERQRTTAHELSHIVLEKERISMALATKQNERRSISHPQIEKHCDLCGDEILLPHEWLRKQISESGARLATIVEIASRTKLSIDFVVSRVVELGLRPWQAIWCTNNSGKLQIQKLVQKWASQDETDLVWIDIVDSPSSPLSKCLKMSGTVSGELTLRIDSKDEQFPAECIKTNAGSALCVLYSKRK